MHEGVVAAPRFDLPGPTHDAGDAHTPLVVRVLGAAVGGIHLLPQPTIVIGKNEEGILGVPTSIDGIHNLPNGVIKALQGGIALSILLDVARNLLKRPMDGIEGDIHEEGLRLLCSGLLHAVV